MSVSNPTRLIGIFDRVALTLLKESKPAYAPYIAAIQAAANEFIGPMGFLAYGVYLGKVRQDVIDQYVKAAKPKFDSVIGVLGVSADVTAYITEAFFTVRWTVSKGGNSVSNGYTIQNRGDDFSPDYLASLANAAARWARYVGNIGVEEVQVILNAAKEGYTRFMTEGTPTAKQLMAAVKHSIRLDAVDPNMYIERLKGATERYQSGYQAGAEKYKTVFAWVGDALRAAFYLTKDIVQVL
jgi:hypothetical protein